MTAELVPERLDELVRARLATSSRQLTGGDVARALRPMAPGSYDDARWAAAVHASIGRARQGDRAARSLIPSAPWKQVVERLVPGLALGLSPDDARGHKRLSDRDAWAAAIVGRALRLWRDGASPTASAVCDELVWSRLELGGKAKRTPPEIRAHFIARELGVERAPADRLMRQLAARLTGAARADLRALREALVRRWLCGEDWGAGASGPPEPEAEPEPEPDPGRAALEEFAAAVRAAAAAATGGLFGERKVFISALWRQLGARDARLSLDDFKRELVAAHRAGLVRLVRADLVAAMDPAEVAASETDHLGAQYHFVEREGGP